MKTPDLQLALEDDHAVILAVDPEPLSPGKYQLTVTTHPVTFALGDLDPRHLREIGAWLLRLAEAARA